MHKSFVSHKQKQLILSPLKNISIVKSYYWVWKELIKQKRKQPQKKTLGFPWI